MSLYHYYPSKEHLMDALTDRVVAEMLPPMEPGPELAWRDRAAAAAIAWRRDGARPSRLFRSSPRSG